MLSKKKLGMVVAGSAAALAAAAPFAFAGDYGNDKGHHHGGGDKNCAFEGGDASARGGAEGGLAGLNVLAPIAGNQIANIGNCSDFLNDVVDVKDNLNGNQIAVLGDNHR
ncbi:hypothetical protein FVA95_18620 [Pseudonocardia sp. EV170527-09]|uniref:hypothetical protein n=1 Tax=Pseudonocardia sp. EV170527-09 TaxID=2603411 RepID=UPI0011F1F778|nr:hypothetical protein [Pseudonocardia sp. EV170527-09]KAA1023203.1 hypothetical protein FVA95_18620 [Pseudonocardia sp. EV170527-09]